MRRSDRVILWTLLLCFPAGLVFMWTDRCRWPRALKSGISLAIAVALVCVFSPLTQPPERAKSGVEIVSTVPAIDAMGPMPDKDFTPLEVYVPHGGTMSPYVAEPTPTPEIIYVYSNDVGIYYHEPDCHYVYSHTPKTSLQYAVDAGKLPCPECAPPILNH